MLEGIFALVVRAKPAVLIRNPKFAILFREMHSVLHILIRLFNKVALSTDKIKFIQKCE